MSTSATLDPSVALDNSMGAMFIGVIVSAVLHGITLLQAFTYWNNYKKDVWYLKTLVSITVSFDAIHLVMISHAVYHHVVSKYHSDKDSLRFITWTVLFLHFACVSPYVLPLNAKLPELLIYQHNIVSKRNYWLAGTIFFLILATAGSGTVWVILSLQFETYEQLLSITPLTITINALSTVVDVAIAASLCIMLHNARTGFRRSDTIITKLIIFVVNTGVLTTCCAVASLICLIASPKSLIYATFYFCIGRLYTNSFLATLNARNSFTSQIDENTTSRMMGSIPTSVISGHQAATNSMKMKNITIRIDTSTTKDALNNGANHSVDALKSQSEKSEDDVRVRAKNGDLY
ncbi:hypothetical protein JR316_0011287 [Psilocybe cubensis]|uniref:Uncharacterized protein n=1 Tax=Psilocybe cubensis TaxID=181762 RepID=A0ACB8GJ42_PSICU|nr:hypothetical protein JR316_0011287 [Psilocybe cubensis]KAH9475728.1 hypothetical protein JR316_0011287 [Psilocybe cubensis]